MKIECTIPNVWITGRNIKRGEHADVSDDEAKMLEARGQVKILDKPAVKKRATKKRQ